MDNYFTSFRLLTNNIRATRVFNKNRLRKPIWGQISAKKKKERGHFEQRTSSKKAV